MIGEYIYKIGKLKFEQKELTWGNDKKILKIYSDLSAKNPFKDEELKLADIPALIEKYGLIEKFMALILIPNFNLRFLFNPLILWNYYIRGLIYVDQAPNSVLKQIWTDFFFLNKDVVNKFMELGGVLDLVTSINKISVPLSPENKMEQVPEVIQS